MRPSFDERLLNLIWVDYNKLNDVLGLGGAWSVCPRALQFSFAIPSLAIGIRHLLNTREMHEFESEIRNVEELLFKQVSEAGISENYCDARNVLKRSHEFEKWGLYLSEFGDSHSDETKYSVRMLFSVIYADRLNAYQKDYERGVDWWIRNNSSSNGKLNEIYGPFCFMAKRFVSDINGVEVLHDEKPYEEEIGNCAFASFLLSEIGLKICGMIDGN